jgi:hypothetical protein
MVPKNVRLLATGAVLTLLCCGGIDNFDVTEESTTTIPGASLFEQLAGDMGFGSFMTMDLSQSEELKNQGVEKSQIDSARLTALTLTVTEPADGQDLTFMESLKFFVEAQGLERRLIASGGPFPAGENQVELALEDVDLAPYAVAPTMKVTAEVSGRRPKQQTSILARMTLNVDVNVSGVACGE